MPSGVLVNAGRRALHPAQEAAQVGDGRWREEVGPVPFQRIGVVWLPLDAKSMTSHSIPWDIEFI